MSKNRMRATRLIYALSYALVFAAAISPATTIDLSAKSHSLVGSKVPDFRISSGSGGVMNRAKLLGKITIIFYDTRDSVPRNIMIKRILDQKYKNLPSAVRKNILRLPVIDCSSAFLTTMWKRALRQHSRKERVTIYGDWNGSMKSAFRMRPADSNTIIIDSSGVIRYFKSGRISVSEVKTIMNFLKDTTNSRPG